MCLLGVMSFDLLSDLHLAAKIAFIYLNIADIWQTVSDSYTIKYYKTNVQFLGGICPEKCQLGQNSKWPTYGNY